jgi:tetraacyldisaccharide 4'-kinase
MDGTERTEVLGRPHPWMGWWWSPLALAWGCVLRVRHALYDRGLLFSDAGALPTVVIGNLQLGGTGKTPTVLDVAERLERRIGSGRVGVLSRGFGRTTRGFRWVSEASHWQEVGDEPWMIQRQRPSVHVAVCADRLTALQQMKDDRPSLEIVVLDDGFQHRRLKPSHSVVLITEKPRGWWGLVPAGGWRDLPSRANRAEVLALSRSLSAHALGQDMADGAWVMGTPKIWLQRGLTSHAKRVDKGPGSERWRNAGEERVSTECSLPIQPLVVTGIARPHRMGETLMELGIHAAGIAHYPDHHPFDDHDVKAWAAWGEQHGVNTLVTTPKDAVRMAPFESLLEGWECWVIHMSVTWENPKDVESCLESWTQTLPSQG